MTHRPVRTPRIAQDRAPRRDFIPHSSWSRPLASQPARDRPLRPDDFWARLGL